MALPPPWIALFSTAQACPSVVLTKAEAQEIVAKLTESGYRIVPKWAVNEVEMERRVGFRVDEV
jgi:hypothetical protein